MKYQFSVCRSIASLIIVLLLLYVILIASSANRFFDLWALLITLGLCFLMMLIVYETEFLKFIPHALRIFCCRPMEANARFARIASFGSRSVIGTGLVGMLIRLIQMMSNLSDPVGIGVGIATSLICPFYAVLASEIFFAIVHQSFKESESKIKNDSTLPLINAGLPFFFVFFILLVFVVGVLSFSRL